MSDRRRRPPDDSAASDTIRSEFDWGSTSPTAAVVRTTAIADNRELSEMPLLHEAIEIDALERILQRDGASQAGGVRVSFTYACHEVTVDEHGTLAVEPRLAS